MLNINSTNFISKCNFLNSICIRCFLASTNSTQYKTTLTMNEINDFTQLLVMKGWNGSN
ncbi:Uncharacterised protein [Mycobacterium tuberculosis]|nr:Uncharacterised protein [Mycobacterium tuberculosis]